MGNEFKVLFLLNIYYVNFLHNVLLQYWQIIKLIIFKIWLFVGEQLEGK